MKRVLLGCILALLPLAGAVPEVVQPPKSCAVTKTVRATPPKDPNADPFGSGPWYINADRTIWAGWLAPRMTTRESGNKVLWIRPAGADLSISARQIDGSTGKFQVAIRCCYPTGFQPSGLHFSEPGCWEITARAGIAELKFITWVRSEKAEQ